MEAAGTQTDLDEELDFSDIENLLEENAADESDDMATEELDFDLDLDLDEEPSSAGLKMEEDSNIDLFDIDSSETDVSTGSITEELEFDMDDKPVADLDETIIFTPAEQQAAVEAAYETRSTPPPPSAETETKPAGHAAADGPKPAAKKKIGKPIFVVLLVALLGGGLFGATKILDGKNIRIPFVSDLINPLPPDPGNLHITTFGINSRFVDNSTEGKLFVITGKIRNEYSNSRRSVKIIGRLYSTGKKITGCTAAYAGNDLDGPDLASKKKAEIARQLNKPNLTVGPGKLMPFMVVFSKLPDDLEEFTIEVLSSE